jgi:hypothetical protein
MANRRGQVNRPPGGASVAGVGGSPRNVSRREVLFCVVVVVVVVVVMLRMLQYGAPFPQNSAASESNWEVSRYPGQLT